MDLNDKKYSVNIKGATKGFSFTLYLDGTPSSIVGGRAPSDEFDISIPKEYTGEGKIKMYGRKANRTLQTSAYSVPVKLTGKDGQTIDVSELEEPKTPTTPKINKSSNDNKGSLTDEIKEATENKLRKKISKKKTGNNFWDNLK